MAHLTQSCHWIPVYAAFTCLQEGSSPPPIIYQRRHTGERQYNVTCYSVQTPLILKDPKISANGIATVVANAHSEV